MQNVRAFLGTVTSFLLVDAVWISTVVRDLYEREVGYLLIDTPRMLPAVFFYIAYTAGIVLFAVRPALAENRAQIAMLNGALLGGLAYGTYTVTNYSVFESWTFALVWTDIAWGMFLTGLSATCGFFAARRA